MSKQEGHNGNAIDKIVAYFAPIHARRRIVARAQMALIGGYVGGSRSHRSLSQWITGNYDADTVLLPDMALLRERSRDLVRNTPLATGAINTVVTNAVGRGLKLQARIDRDVLGVDDEAAEQWESRTEREWQMWSESQECDIGRTMTFNEIQELVFRQSLENGDVFVAMPHVVRLPLPYSLRLQVIEADRVRNKGDAPNTDRLSGGVEKDEHGAPVRYHILRHHPGNMYASMKREWDEVPAFNEQTGMRNVLHLYRTLRPGQSRGVPYLAPVIESLKQLARYTEAELMAAVLSGMLTVFVESERGSADFGGGFPETPQTEINKDEYKLGNGAIIGLAPGEKVSTMNPARPNQAFDPFVKSILQQIGVALEIPYEVLIHHFSASYSASRAALLESWRYFRIRRSWLAQNFCQVVYQQFLAEAVARGRISAPGFFSNHAIRHAYSGSLWIGDAPGQIDPLKEVNAADRRLSLGISTIDEETVTLTGGDFERNYPRIKKERQMLQAIGMWTPVKGEAAPNKEIKDDDGGDEE